VSDQARYRVENGESVVDLHLAGIERLFDNRDPAPFRERDLDPDLVEYMLAASEDLLAEPARIVFWLDKSCQPNEIEAAFRAHFEYELERVDRRRRRNRRTGQLSLLVAVVLITLLLALAQLVGRLATGSLGAGLKEGLTISCWVLMWRPVEVLVYEWIPWRRERKIIRKLLAIPIDVRIGTGPPSS
jgi:hypothetical protein